jgi:hypothetical protein
MLAVAAALTVFCIVWWLTGEEEEWPWVIAGICASMTLGIAAMVREVLLRRLYIRFRLERDRTNRLNAVAVATPGKLSIERHAVMLRELESKSRRANSSAIESKTHLDIFRACNDYLARTGREIPMVAVGSPRLAAFRHGQEVVKGLHRRHLLMWAAGESNILTQEARIRVTITEKIETAQRALSVLESALHYYPDEPQLLESVKVIKGFIASVRISNLTEEAEKQAFKGRYAQAIDFYQDALFYLSKEAENIGEDENELIKREISHKIGDLHRVLNG